MSLFKTRVILLIEFLMSSHDQISPILTTYRMIYVTFGYYKSAGVLVPSNHYMSRVIIYTDEATIGMFL